MERFKHINKTNIPEIAILTDFEQNFTPLTFAMHLYSPASTAFTCFIFNLSLLSLVRICLLALAIKGIPSFSHVNTANGLRLPRSLQCKVMDDSGLALCALGAAVSSR